MTTASLARSRAPAWARRFDWLPTWLLAPAVVLMLLLMVYPIARGIALSFFNTRLLTYSQGQYIGLDNYVALLDDPYFWNSLHVTATYAAGCVVLTYAVGLGLALLLNAKLPLGGIFRTLLIVPWAIPEVVAVLIFVWMLDAQYGVINYFMIELGFIDRPLAWLSEAGLAMPALLMVTVWQQYPLAMLILLAGLKSIPEEQFEAAKVDGAGALQRFLYVTLPGLRPVNVVLVLILILNSFRRVTVIYAMTAGGPARATETLSILTYNTAFQYQRIGYASTIGTILLLILLGFSVLYLHFLHRGEHRG